MKKILYIITILFSFIIGFLTDQSRQGKKRFLLEEKNNKTESIIKLLDLWIQQKQRNKLMSVFFERNHFHRIAVYGMNDLGKRVVDELRETSTTVVYAIDKRAGRIDEDLRVVHPEEELDTVDAIVVTPVFYFEEIERQLMSKTSCPILSLEDVINNL